MGGFDLDLALRDAVDEGVGDEFGEVRAQRLGELIPLHSSNVVQGDQHLLLGHAGQQRSAAFDPR